MATHDYDKVFLEPNTTALLIASVTQIPNTKGIVIFQNENVKSARKVLQKTLLPHVGVQRVHQYILKVISTNIQYVNKNVLVYQYFNTSRFLIVLAVLQYQYFSKNFIVEEK